MDESTKEVAKEKLKAGLQKHWKVLAVVLLTAALIITVMLLNSSHRRQREIEEQLERQNELVAAMQEQLGIEDTNEKVTITSDTIKESLGAIRELVTQEYIYTNADKRESSEKWLWGVERPFSGNSLLVTYDGTIKAGVDLSQVEITVDEEKQTITVILPPSKITDNNIPQESIEVVEVKNGLFNDVTFDNYNEFIAEQKVIMEQKAIDQGLLTKADEEAIALVKSVLSVLPGMDSYTLTVEQSN